MSNNSNQDKSTGAHTPLPIQIGIGADNTGYPTFFICGLSGDQKRDADLHKSNAALLEKACNSHYALVGALKTHEQWLVERIEWLRKEANGGGNWAHLKARMDESAYVLDKFRAALSLTGADR